MSSFSVFEHPEHTVIAVLLDGIVRGLRVDPKMHPVDSDQESSRHFRVRSDLVALLAQAAIIPALAAVIARLHEGVVVGQIVDSDLKEGRVSFAVCSICD